MSWIDEKNKFNSILDDETEAFETDAIGKITGSTGIANYETLIDNAPKKEDNSGIFEEEQTNLEVIRKKS